jgi:hypothetical protein
MHDICVHKNNKGPLQFYVQGGQQFKHKYPETNIMAA